jgi:hypothetical protein
MKSSRDEVKSERVKSVSDVRMLSTPESTMHADAVKSGNDYQYV